MALTPRKNELDAVIGILESDEYETPAEMARAVVKAVGAELSKRDAFGVAIGLRTDSTRLAHGPYFTILEAKRVAKEAEARGLVSYIAPLLGAANALTEEVEATHKQCVCGHPQALHGSSIKPKAVTSIGCGVYDRQKTKCPCKGYGAA
jgi:2,4-dienoyl-CoA reductase-like NADH-dependent reductase (Old Yellow Enzyme family)